MEVLHLHSGNLFGGVETLLITLARNGRGSGEVKETFGLAFDGQLAHDLRGEGGRVEILGPVRASRPVTVWSARRTLRALLKRCDYAAAVCHSPWALALFGPVARAVGIPLVLWLHDAIRGRHWVDRWAQRTQPDLVICNSRFTEETLPRLFPRVRSTVLYCPVDPPESGWTTDRTAAREELRTADDAIVVVQVGRLEPYKGHVAHLRALARIRDLDRWVLWIVGGAQRPQEERYLAELEHLSAELGIADRVRFLGQRADVHRYLHAADLYCQPNLLPEPFGIAIVEAMYARLPVVTTGFGGAREIVTDASGLLVPPGDADGLTDALARLIRSPELRAQLASAGPARAREISDPAKVLADFAAVIGTLHESATAGR